MIHIPTLFFVLLLYVVLFKLTLQFVWTRKLFRLHKDHYAFSRILYLLGIQSAWLWPVAREVERSDPKLWKDMRKFAGYNILSDFLLGILGLSLVIGAVALNRKGIRIDLPSFMLIAPS